jgi:hypothetical protein
MHSSDDRIVLAYYDGLGSPQYQIFDFNKLKPGSGARSAKVSEYERFKEALVGQGCEIFVWDIVYWQRMQIPFFTGKFRGTKR